MRKNIYLSMLLPLCAIAGLVITHGCTREHIGPESVDQGEPFSRGSYNDGYFAWDSITQILTKNNLLQPMLLPLPWTPGSANVSGMPSHWIDENAESSNYAQRYYSRQNGWRMLYSNMNRYSETNRYFALYNVNTGILRFFVYGIGSSTGSSTSDSYGGLNFIGSTGLMNFMEPTAIPYSNRKTNPAFSTSMSTYFEGSKQSVGYTVNMWYGVEIECAYDPQVVSGSKLGFALFGAIITNTTGTANTAGTITGTITHSAPNMPNLALNFGPTSNVNITNTTSVADHVGTVVSDGVTANDPFFKTLWGSIKSAAGLGVSTGVKQGIAAILNGGASSAVKLLGGLVDNMLGGGNQNISKVDLKIQTTTTFDATSITNNLGFGTINNLPAPGSGSADPPLYNNKLGVWNLSATPTVTLNMFVYPQRDANGIFQSGTYDFMPLPANYDLVINPVVSANFDVRNVTTTILVSEYDRYKFAIGAADSPFGINEGVKYNILGSGRMIDGQNPLTVTQYDEFSQRFNAAVGSLFRMHITFDLVHKTTGETYTFSKYFNAQVIKGTMYDFGI